MMMGRMMEITCPDCGHIFSLQITGRKKTDVDVTIIYDAIRITKSYRAAARYVNRKCSMNISGSLVHKIISQEAARRGLTRDDLVEKIRKER